MTGSCRMHESSEPSKFLNRNGVRTDKNDVHEFYLMCDDVEALVAEMKKSDIACEPVQNQGWGLLTHLTLPGGGRLGIYQPRHARPKPMGTGKSAVQVTGTKKKKGK